MGLLIIKPESALSEFRKKAFALFSLFFLILIIYSNTFDASWHFDDNINILDNKPLHLTELSFENIKNTFFADYRGRGQLYRPIPCLTFALNYYLGGQNVFGYHVVNLIIHFISGYFLFLFIYHTLNLPNLKSRYVSNAYFIALLSTVFWAINPVQTQAVTYVVQRMTSMAGLFSIMAMYFYVKGKTSTVNPARMGYYMGCCLSGILALGSKENAIMLPLIFLAYHLMFISGITRRNLKKYSLYLALVLGICIMIVLLLEGPSFFSPERLVSSYRNRGFTLWERLLTEPRVILFYISLLLYPMPDRLCLEHNITISTGLLAPISTLVSILAVILILCLAILWSRKRPLISFCILFFFVNHVVESSVLPLELIFEHRNYFPSMLFFVPIAMGISTAISYLPRKVLFRRLITGSVILVLIAWGHGTFVRNAVWQNDETLLGDCILKYPELSRPHHNLGAYYGKRNKFPEAISEYLKALQKENPNNLVAQNWTYYNLGALYQQMRMDEKALYYYNEAQKFQPDFSPTHVGKGLLFMKEGRYDEAESSFQKAIHSNPANSGAHGNLGFLYLLSGNTEKAISSLQMASQKDPENAKALRHLGIAYKLDGDTKKAFMQFKKSLSRDPADPLTLLNLACIYDEKDMIKQKKETMAQFFAVLERNKITLQKFKNSLGSKSGIDDFLVTHRKALLRTVEDAHTNQHLR